MELRDYLRVLRKRWPVLVVLTLLGGLVAAGATAMMTPRYESTTQLYVAVRTTSAEGASDLVQGTTYARQAVISYVDVVTSAIVLDQVADELGLDATSQQLEQQLKVSTPSDSVLINITASGTDPEAVAELANTTGSVFASTVTDQIEMPDANGASRVQIITIQPASVPTQESSPSLFLNLAIGLALGLLFGLAIALLREVTDTRIHSGKDVQELTDAPLLGAITFDPESKRRPLIVHADPRNPRAERFRSLRTNLQFVAPNRQAKVFVVSSAVPGEGKSVTTANLAISLAQAGAKVALIDGDLRSPSIATYMGIEGGVGLTDVLIGRAELCEVVQEWGRDGLVVLPAGSIPPNPSELLGSTAMAVLLAELSERFEYVLIDSPPMLLVTDAAVSAQNADGVLLVAAAGSSRRPQVSAAIQAFERVHSNVLGAIVTKVPVKGMNVSAYGGYVSGNVDRVYGGEPALVERGKHRR